MAKMAENETSEASDQHCDFARLATWGQSQSSALDRVPSTIPPHQSCLTDRRA